jgi:hypothetical protein
MTTLDRNIGIVGLMGAAGCALGLWIDAKTILASYLVSWIALSAIPIGGIAVLLTSYLVRGGWTFDLYPLLSRSVLTLPIFAILLIPILLGTPWLYPWAADTQGLSAFQSGYLTLPFFVVRSVIYFLVWTVIAIWAARAYGNDFAMRRAASVGLIIWTLLVSFAGIDWVESLEPDFHSSIYGFLFITFQLVAGLSFAIATLLLSGRGQQMSNAAYSGTLLSVLLLWAYMHAMQYIIIWAGNIPDEVLWYLKRLDSGWRVALWFLFIGQFIVPFFALLSEQVRASTRALLLLAVVTLAFRFLEAAILILPALDLNLSVLWLDVPATITITAAAALFAWRYADRLWLSRALRRATAA